MRAAKNVATGLGTARELLRFLWQQKRWWMIPFVVTLLLVAVLLLVGSTTGVAPFIYTLF